MLVFLIPTKLKRDLAGLGIVDYRLT